MITAVDLLLSKWHTESMTLIYMKSSLRLFPLRFEFQDMTFIRSKYNAFTLNKLFDSTLVPNSHKILTSCLLHSSDFISTNFKWLRHEMKWEQCDGCHANIRLTGEVPITLLTTKLLQYITAVYNWLCKLVNPMGCNSESQGCGHQTLYPKKVIWYAAYFWHRMCF